ncbi:unnamed protein product, partial [Adineta steineri]
DDIMLKAHRERKLLRPYSPLDARQTNQERDDESNVQSLTGTSNMEKRPPVKKENDKPIDKQS